MGLLVTVAGFILPNTDPEKNISTSLGCSLFIYKNRWLDKIITEVPSNTAFLKLYMNKHELILLSSHLP